MISDFVKGKKKYDFPLSIQKGIELHRLIDRFTDDHPAVHDAKQFFRPFYRLYSGAMVDVVFDHYLAIEPTVFNEQELLSFSGRTYSMLEMQKEWFPERFAYMYPYMRDQNWLFNYRYVEGIEKKPCWSCQKGSFYFR